jgi:hypothetical protein
LLPHQQPFPKQESTTSVVPYVHITLTTGNREHAAHVNNFSQQHPSRQHFPHLSSQQS